MSSDIAVRPALAAPETPALFAWRPLPDAVEYRVCARVEGQAVTLYTGPDATLEAAAGMLRVEARLPDEDFRTWVPWMAFGDAVPEAAHQINLVFNVAAGSAWRLILQDGTAGVECLRVSTHAPQFVLDRRTVPMHHTLTYRFFAWDWAGQGWQELVADRHLPGSGPWRDGANDDMAGDFAAYVVDWLQASGATDADVISLRLPSQTVLEYPLQDPELLQVLQWFYQTQPVTRLRCRINSDPVLRPISLPAILSACETSLQTDVAFPSALFYLTRHDDTPENLVLMGQWLAMLYLNGLCRQPEDYQTDALALVCQQLNRMPDRASRGIREVLASFWAHAQAILLVRMFDVHQQFHALPVVAKGDIEVEIQRLQSSPAYADDLAAFSLVMGKLASLVDREWAAVLFAQVPTALPSWTLLFAHEQGLLGYYGTQKLAEAQAALAAERAERFEALQIQSRPVVSGDTIVLILSCTPQTFALHGPYWLSVAPLLQGAGLAVHCLLLGEKAACETVIAQAAQVSGAIQSLRQLKLTPAQLTFSIGAMPDAEQAETLRQTAPFLYLRKLANTFDRPCLVADIDFIVRANPTVFRQQLPPDTFAFSFSHALHGLDPWRRVLPSLFWYPNTPDLEAAMDAMETHLLLSLQSGQAAHVAANALLGLADQWRAISDVQTTDLRRLESALYQPGIQALYQREYACLLGETSTP